MTTKLEAKTQDGEWSDLSRYLRGTPARSSRAARKVALRARMASLPHLLDSTGGTGNPMVNLCRSGTEQSARDKARRLKGGDGQTAPLHPNARLRTYGIKATLDAREEGGFKLLGGTARQRASYLRAVDRYMGHGDPIGEAL